MGHDLSRAVTWANDNILEQIGNGVKCNLKGDSWCQNISRE